MSRFLTIILVIGLIGGGIFAWTRYQTPDVEQAEPAAENERLTRLRRLHTLTFDTAFLQDAGFRSLEAPPAQAITAPGAGRTNPFAPL